jgi:hypothetical protein
MLAMAFLAILVPGSPAPASSSDDVKMDPAVCEVLQRRVDEVAALGESSELTDDEKIARLTASIASSLATMLNVTRNDPDAAKIAQEWVTMLNQVLTAASPTGARSDTEARDVPSGAERGMQIARNRLKPYVAVLKLMCPDLVLPSSVAH